MAIYQWNLAQLHFGRKSMKYGIILTEIWQTKNNWKKWQRISESWHTSELGIKVKLCQNFHFHLFDMIWEPLELEESKYSTESWLLNQLLLTMLVQPIYLPEVNEAYQSTCPDGKINQYKLQHFKRTEQQHNFFRVPFSFAEKNSHSQRQNI